MIEFRRGVERYAVTGCDDSGRRTTVTQSILDLEGRAVPYTDEGEGPVTLVLLTERGMDADGLGVISHYLAEEAGFRVVRIASRTTDDSGDATRAERVDDAIAVLDHLGIADTWIGGYGIGGTLARVFAAEHTDRVNGLLLLGVEEEHLPLAEGIPVLIVQGATDSTLPPENGERLRASAPERASVTTIAGADHLLPATHPIEAAVVIEEYLDWD